MNPEVFTGGALETVRRDVSPERLVRSRIDQQPYIDVEFVELTRIRGELNRQPRLIPAVFDHEFFERLQRREAKSEKEPKRSSLFLGLLDLLFACFGVPTDYLDEQLGIKK